MRLTPFFLLGALAVFGCSAPTSDAVTGDDANQTSAAAITLSADFHATVTGTLQAGQPVRIAYALERLPQCRGNMPGGRPGWSVTGYYSENGGAAKTFDVSALAPDGKDNLAAPGTITPSQGGDLALWFEIHSAWGCEAFDSQYGQNYHFTVKGAAPTAGATLVFKADGSVDQSGPLKAGTKVAVHYEQDRLGQCRQTQMGHPVWSITGFAQLDGEVPRTFDTARPDGADRVPVDALVELPHAGQLALWFQSVSVSGCMQYDSKGGANYRFQVE